MAGNESVEGRYANYFVVGHNALEFLVDFGQMYGESRERIHSRMVMSPQYARELLRVLHESVATYEREYGTIADPHEAPLKGRPGSV